MCGLILQRRTSLRQPASLHGNGGIRCLLSNGTELWHYPLGEAQHVVAGRFRRDSEVQFAVVDRTPVPTHRRDASAWSILYLYDLQGEEIWHRQQEPGDCAIAPIRMNWLGPNQAETNLVYGHWQDRTARLRLRVCQSAALGNASGHGYGRVR